MPRSFITGSQVGDGSITEADLATDSVSTDKIKDGNVTCPKLAPGICDRLLNSTTPITRTKLTADLAANTDLTLPGGASYIDSATFLARAKIYRNGVLQYSGASGLDTNADVYPGSDATKIKFTYDLRKGDTIIAEIL